MKSALGFDLNGLWDFVAEGDGENEPVLKDLGIRGSMVRLATDQAGTGKPNRWIGGPQAALAPHGRGSGWGKEIGAAENRVFWTDVLNAIASDTLTPAQSEAVNVFLDGLVDEPSSAHVAVPDAWSFDEPARDRLLRLLSQTRRLRATLLWRPIAGILGWLEEPLDRRGFQPAPGMRIGVLSLMSGGIQFADAKLIREGWRDGDLWVPERSVAGLEVRQGLGGEVMVEERRLDIASRMQEVDQATVSVANAPWRAAVGQRPGFELVRLPNRSWRRVPDSATPRIAISHRDVPEEFRERVASAEALIVEGPMAGNEGWAQAVLQAIGGPKVPAWHGGRELVAQGCLTAALRTAAGAPVYYDFLPQLEINALVGGEPRFVELVPKHERLLGGAVYRGAAPGEFSIGKGATRPVFYLFKEDLPKGRKAEVDLPEEADREHRIFVSVEQSPGQGFAQVRVTSDSFETLRRRPIELDWSTMELVEQTKEEILESLSGQGGLSYPDAVSTPGHPFLWYPGHPKGDLLDQLRVYLERPLIRATKIDALTHKNLKILRDRFSKSEKPHFVARKIGVACDEIHSRHPLSGDGSIPNTQDDLSIDEIAGELLDAALIKAENELKLVIECNSLRKNEELVRDLVGFLTWCFWRCPISVTNVLLEVYEGHSDVSIHHILYREGLGRVLHTSEEMNRYFEIMDWNLQSTKNLVSSEFAALSRMLSTCPQAAETLRKATANMVLQDTITLLAAVNLEPRQSAYKKKFKNALRALAGLLRHRRIRPDFLEPDGYAGKSLLDVLKAALVRNEDFKIVEERSWTRSKGADAAKHRNAARRFEGNAVVIRELIAMVNREGSDPNIIRKIEQMEE